MASDPPTYPPDDLEAALTGAGDDEVALTALYEGVDVDAYPAIPEPKEAPDVPSA